MYSMTIELETDNGKKLYEQIYEHIKKEIREGKFLAGEKLPSTRSLAQNLMVARSTVEYAYEQLLAEGYIEAIPCKGYFVCHVEELYQLHGGADLTEYNQKEKDKYLYDFSPSATDMSLFPYTVWRRINKQVLTSENKDIFQAGDPQGDEKLRDTICRYLHDSRGVNCSKEQIIIGAGNDYLLMLLEKIFGEKQIIAMEDPTYKRAYQIFETFGFDIELIEMDFAGMDIGKLRESRAKLAYVMPSHQFPTGIVMPIGRRMELLKWAGEEDGRYIVEDDYDSEFRYKGKPIPALQGVDGKGKVIYIGTFSKSIAPTIRVSYMVLPKTLLERYKARCNCYSTTVSRIDQNILNEFIRDGYFERYLNKMRTCYRKKHDLLMQMMTAFGKDFEISGENSGLHILMTSKKGISEKDLIERAKEAGVKVYGLSEAHIRTKESNTVLIGYGNLTETEITEGMKKLKEVWR